MKKILAEGSNSTNAHPFKGLPFSAFWVFLSGKEMLGRKPWLHSSKWHYLIVSVIWLAVGIAGILNALQGGPLAIPFYIISTILIVGGARYMVATNIHMMAHNLMFKKASVNLWWGEILTTVFFIQSYTRYRADHLKHHGKVFGTLEDGDGLSVVKLGFTAEKTPTQLWMNLIRLSLSPLFHFNFIKGRAKENFILCPNYRKLLTIAWLAILVLVTKQFGMSIVLHAYILPVILLSQIASLLQLLCEHVWISTNLGSRDRHLLLTNARYCGVPLPRRGSSYAQYAACLCGWALRILFVELPARIVVFQGSLPEHDWHHRHPGSKQWSNGMMLREEEIKSELDEKGSTNYSEVWGSFEILNRVFHSISRSQPYPELNELVLSGKLDYGDIK